MKKILVILSAIVIISSIVTNIVLTKTIMNDNKTDNEVAMQLFLDAHAQIDNAMMSNINNAYKRGSEKDGEEFDIELRRQLDEASNKLQLADTMFKLSATLNSNNKLRLYTLDTYINSLSHKTDRINDKDIQVLEILYNKYNADCISYRGNVQVNETEVNQGYIDCIESLVELVNKEVY